MGAALEAIGTAHAVVPRAGRRATVRYRHRRRRHRHRHRPPPLPPAAAAASAAVIADGGRWRRLRRVFAVCSAESTGKSVGSQWGQLASGPQPEEGGHAGTGGGQGR